MDTLELADQQQFTFVSSVRTLGTIYKNNADWDGWWEKWPIGMDGEGKSKEPVLPASFDDEDVDDDKNNLKQRAQRLFCQSTFQHDNDMKQTARTDTKYFDDSQMKKLV